MDGSGIQSSHVMDSSDYSDIVPEWLMGMVNSWIEFIQLQSSDIDSILYAGCLITEYVFHFLDVTDR